MTARYDAVVVGAGHNGLTAAAYLAKAGRKVLVVERRDAVGGLAAGEEFCPGYRTAGVLHDTGAVRPWVVEQLKLREHGLELLEVGSVLVPEREGQGPGLLLTRDPQTVASSDSGLDGRDAERYAEYRAFLERVTPFFRRVLDRVPPVVASESLLELVPAARTALALRRLGRKVMMEILRVAPMCIADWLDEWFESELLKAALAAPALHATFTGPRSPGSNTALLIAETTTDRRVMGGPQALVSALERAARANGAEIRSGVPVERVELSGGRVCGVTLGDGERVESRMVAASCHPTHLFFDLLPVGVLPLQLEQHIRHYRTRGTTAKVNLALRGYPACACRPEARAATIRIGESLEVLERAFDAVKYRQFSSHPMLEISVPTLEQPELGPDGHHVFSILVHFAAHDLEEGWSDEQRERLYDVVVETLSRYAPGVADLIVGHEVLAPTDLESRYGVVGGNLNHGEPAIDQLLARPTPECSRYATPFPGLFLCGSGSHPGGGITCAPGALAAQVMTGS